MDVRVTHHSISISRGENGTLSKENEGKKGAFCNFCITTKSWFLVDPFHDPKLAEFRQQVNTRFRKRKNGIWSPWTSNDWHDDGYAMKDGTSDHDGKLVKFIDPPGVEVFFGETLEYEFQFKQIFYNKIFNTILTQSPPIKVTMNGTYDNIIFGGQHTYNWEYPVLKEREFRTDVDF